MKSSKKWIWIVLLIVALGGFGAWKWTQPKGPSYKEYTVQKDNLKVTILSTGTVQPENRLEIKAPVAGRIDEVLVKEGDHVKKGQILARMSSTERAALLDAAHSRGPEEYKHWEDLYRPTPIIAPLPGTIILRSVEPGQTITTTDAILAMSDRLTVKAQVDETDIAKIKLHQKAEIILDAYPDQALAASVDQIAFEAKTVNNVTTYVVDVLPEKTPDFMRSGMTANVRFFQQAKDDVLALPAEAIFVADGKSKVLVKNESGKPFEKEIQVGLSDGKKTEITEGLHEGDIVLREDLSKSEKKTSSSPFSPMGGRRPPSGGGRR